MAEIPWVVAGAVVTGAVAITLGLFRLGTLIGKLSQKVDHVDKCIHRIDRGLDQISSRIDEYLARK